MRAEAGGREGCGAIAALFPDGVVMVRATPALEGAALHPAEAPSVAGATEARRREFAAGRACARAALARLGLPPVAIPSRADRAPAWPEGVVGSIAHCRGYCAAALARQGPILGLGLDAEVAGRVGCGVAARVLGDAEIEAIARLERGGAQPAAFWRTLYFSAKESAFKCYYPLAGARLGFRDLEIEVDAEAARFRAVLLRRDAPAAAGARRLHGRFAREGGIVVTGVALAAGEVGRAGA